MKDQILADYNKNKKTFIDFKDRVEHLLKDLLLEQGIQIHQINSRTKTIESLSKKIDVKNKKYEDISEITDIIGLRIITYLESDVDSISDLIEKEFIKDEKNSIDKRNLKADQFGYRSLHIVASFSTDRCILREYERYKGIKCEIQIRSILQHAWAEIEHDLGYKGEISIPEKYKRTFNRLSALLETADIEFDRLKSDLADYENQLPGLIKSKPEFVDINQASVRSFINTNEILEQAELVVEGCINQKLRPREDVDDHMIRLVLFFKIDSIAKLEDQLITNKIPFLDFVKAFAENNLKDKTAPYQSAMLLYFLHYLAGKSQDLTIVSEYLKVFFEENYKENMVDIFGKNYIDLYNKIQ